MAGTEPIGECRSYGNGWVMGPDGQWQYAGYGYDSLDSYRTQYTDSVAPWEQNPDAYRTRFYRDTLSPEQLEQRRRAQLDSMDAAYRGRSYGDTVRIRPAAPLETDDQEPEERPEPEPQPQPAPEPFAAPADPAPAPVEPAAPETPGL